MPYTLLPDRAFIRISGDDSSNFLQGITTNDVLKNPVSYGALLTPQGKFLHDFIIIADQNGLLLDTERQRADDLLKRLTKYKLRSQVSIELAPAVTVAAVWGTDVANMAKEMPNMLVIKDPRLEQLGMRAIGERMTLMEWLVPQKLQPATYDEYDRLRLALGVPDGSRDIEVERNLILECGFDGLHGVDFKKGCYVGQEVTARSKFRGQLKKHLYRVQLPGGTLPERDTPIMAGDKEIGEMRSSSGDIGLALLRIEDLEAAQSVQMPVTAAGKTITVSLPEWVKIAA